jgi:hypothetical protein
MGALPMVQTIWTEVGEVDVLSGMPEMINPWTI